MENIYDKPWGSGLAPRIAQKSEENFGKNTAYYREKQQLLKTQQQFETSKKLVGTILALVEVEKSIKNVVENKKLQMRGGVQDV